MSRKWLMTATAESLSVEAHAVKTAIVLWQKADDRMRRNNR